MHASLGRCVECISPCGPVVLHQLLADITPVVREVWDAGPLGIEVVVLLADRVDQSQTLDRGVATS